ncbi:hypothetical protein [Rhodococcus oxybenzonivorans]|uniref:hypothetical protein n=1 Tax=Rhodococcus oxybenzonivorans TaxID=1990687 RepID=UPI0013A5337F|nr:hypothetical protein [Rhodococcus oxybenzonivorans]
MASNLGQPAQQMLNKCVDQFKTDLLNEADRLEAAGNSASGVPEVTASHVHDANIMLRRKLTKPRRSKLTLALQLITVVAAALTGWSSNNMDKNWGIALFVASVMITVLVGAIVWVRNE